MKCNYKPPKLTKEEQQDMASIKSTLPYIDRLQIERRDSESLEDDYCEDAMSRETAYWDWQVDGTHFCSECGYDAPLKFGDEQKRIQIMEYYSKFCPHCGKRMTYVETPNDTGIGEYACDE